MSKDEALKLALEALSLYIKETNSKSQRKAIAAIKAALAQPPTPRNFCPRCGKRFYGMMSPGGIHTCTPPEGGHQ